MFRLLLVIMAAFALPQSGDFGNFTDKIAMLSKGWCVKAVGEVTLDSGDEKTVSDLNAMADSKRYIVSGGGNVFACDGTVNYMVDEYRKEVTVSRYEESSSSAVSNPLAVLTGIGKDFSVESVNRSEAGVEVVRLEPVRVGTGIESVELRLRNAVPDKMLMTVNVLGTKMKMEVVFSDFTFVEGCNGSDFKVDLAKYESEGYFINDIR